METLMTLKILKIISAALGLCFWAATFFMWNYYASHGDAIREPISGKIYPLNNHGATVYLNSNEHYFLYGLMVSGALFALLAGVFYFFGDTRK